MLTSLALLLIVGLFLGHICSLVRLPSLVGMLLAGIILGDSGFGFLDSSLLSISLELRQIALVIILLRAGLALNLNELKRVGRPALLICFVPACFEILGVVIVAPPLLGVSILEAAIIGSVVAAVSPAVIVPKMLNLMDQRIGTNKSIPQMIMAGGSIDDVFVIVLFTAFTTLALGGELSAVSFAQIPISILLGLALGALSGWGLTKFFGYFKMRDTIKLIVILSTAFLFLSIEAWCKGSIPISGLLAVMSMGVAILRWHDALAKRISPKLNKMWVGAEVLLFVLVGASVNIEYATGAGFGAIGVIALALIFRICGVILSMVATPLTFGERLFCAFAYMPKATVQAAIGGLPLALGLACGNIVLTTAVLAILITAPLGALAIDLSYNKLLTKE